MWRYLFCEVQVTKIYCLRSWRRMHVAVVSPSRRLRWTYDWPSCYAAYHQPWPYDRSWRRCLVWSPSLIFHHIKAHFVRDGLLPCWNATSTRSIQQSLFYLAQFFTVNVFSRRLAVVCQTGVMKIDGRFAERSWLPSSLAEKSLQVSQRGAPQGWR